MIYLLYRKFKTVIKKHWWLSIILSLLALHACSAAALLILEYKTFDAGSPAATLWKGTWWFFVTATTVGYGDVHPTTIPGQVVATFDMIFGIGLMMTFIGAGVENFLSRRTRKLKGQHAVKLKDHIVVLGGGAYPKLYALVQELQNDPIHEDREIVVCSKAYEENPFPDVVEFIRGDIGSDNTLQRSCTEHAAVIIIYGYTDDETILTALAVDGVNRKALTTVYIRNRENIRHIERLNAVRKEINAREPGADYPMIAVITRINDLMLAREVSNPDLSAAILHLMTLELGQTFFSIQAWPEMDACIQVTQVRQLLRNEGHALFLGIRRYENGELVLNPSETTYVCPKDHLFVIAERRPYIDWDSAMNGK